MVSQQRLLRFDNTEDLSMKSPKPSRVIRPDTAAVQGSALSRSSLNYGRLLSQRWHTASIRYPKGWEICHPGTEPELTRSPAGERLHLVVAMTVRPQ
jgi:hypothetical protein